MEFNGISITVCCYNDGKLLPNFLDSFLQQTPVNCAVELNVIDNASIDNTPDIYNHYQNKFKQLKLAFNYFHEAKRGLNHARNRGINEAKYTYIGFTDADAKFDIDYLNILQKTIIEQNPLIIFGPYFPWYNMPKPLWYKDEYNSYFLNRKADYVNDNQYPNGINMVFEINTLKEIGSFSTKIVYKGINDRGEETELFYRYKAKFNYKHIFYNPALKVYHYTRPQTMHLNHWIKSNWGTGKNHAKFMAKTSIVRNIKDILWIVKTIIASFFGYLFKSKQYQYTYYQNFLIEKIFSHIYGFSLAFHRLKQNNKN